MCTLSVAVPPSTSPGETDKMILEVGHKCVLSLLQFLQVFPWGNRHNDNGSRSQMCTFSVAVPPSISPGERDITVLKVDHKILMSAFSLFLS